MSRDTWNLFAAILLAIGLPVLALSLATPAERSSLGLSISPFGKLRLLLSHLALAIPFSLACVGLLPRWGTTTNRFFMAIIALALLTFLVPAFADLSQASRAGSTASTLIRSLLAVGFTFPWIYMLTGATPASVTQWIGSVLILTAPLIVYAERLEEAHSQEFQESSAAGQLVKAQAALEMLADLGSDRKFGKKNVPELQVLLKRDIDRLTQITSQGLPSSAKVDDKLRRALQLLQLNRIAEAEQLFATLPEQEVSVRFGKLAILKQTQRWEEVVELSRQLVVQLPQDPAIYETWGESLQKLNRYEEALDVYRRGEEVIPQSAGRFQLQQGLIHADRGQSDTAKRHFEKAVVLEPKLASAIEGPMRRLRTDSFSCLSR